MEPCWKHAGQEQFTLFRYNCWTVRLQQPVENRPPWVLLSVHKSSVPLKEFRRWCVRTMPAARKVWIVANTRKFLHSNCFTLSMEDMPSKVTPIYLRTYVRTHGWENRWLSRLRRRERHTTQHLTRLHVMYTVYIPEKLGARGLVWQSLV